ncbi:outer membrane protein transport protein [Aliivibrio fischeri]|uniref:outer membrane protein transport protein n=1 Tax=Aliivibrio fischeri TaxID=668 RepID=UPI0006CFD155|nr:OmpP1/FadL family transporter [Aliivibrio fischeri]USR94796.1 OmpP1/FadL family transporter [Aliivibrio fischeri ATCC 7744 = JCM 18803 = DSM 507]GGK41289.1 long-chain fatty acid transporter [Aliivibrio fischeri]
MNKKRLFSKTLLAATITLATQQATAAGFQLNAQSATGLGRAFAGDAVIADNASVMSRNAAAMALFDSSQFSAGLNYIDTDIEVSDVKYLGQDVDDANNGSGTPVPNIYYIHRLNDKWAFGAGIYSNFGTENNFDNSFGKGSGFGMAPDATVFGGTTEIKSVNFALTTSYRINEQWSVGGGIDVIYGTGVLKREAVLTNPATGAEMGRASLVDIDASGTGVGFNLGTVYELDERNRFGFSYHYSPEIEAEDGNQKVTLPLPDMIEFSGYHEIKDTKFAVHYSVQYIGWSDFDKIEFTNNPSGLSESVYDWQNGMHYAIGGTYFLNDAWTLRAGYMYDTAAQDELTSISVPDSDRQWFSAGFSYHFEKKHTIDFGFTYLMGDDVDVTENAAPGVDLTATTHADAILAGVQYSYSF